MIKKLTIITIFLMLICVSTKGQSVEIKPHGISSRGVEADSNDIFKVKYNGLSNVGVGTTVYLVGEVVDTTFTNPVWNVKTKPSNSNVTIIGNQDVSNTKKAISLILDLEGTYVIEFTDGGLTSEITLNAAKYLGIPTTGLSCGTCHAEENTNWLETGHANAVKPYIDDPKGHFQAFCLGCHTTGYDVAASNDGFDDFDFVFPSTLVEGNYDTLVNKYPAAMQRANVQCEACHGPGSAHNGIVADSKMISDQASATCAYCHDAGTHHAIPALLAEAGLDATEFDGRGFHGGHTVGAFVNSTNRDGCSPCHSGAGYVQWIKEGRPSDALGLPAKTAFRPKPTNFTCVTCHDPHNSTNPFQLRAKETVLGDGTLISFQKYS